MNIQSISELSPLSQANSAWRALSANNTYIEASWKNSNKYDSVKISLTDVFKSLESELNVLSSLALNLSNEIKHIKGNYLPLAGGTLTGDATLACKILNVSNQLSCANTINIKDGAVKVTSNGVLECKNDIKGCALSARWC